MATYKGMDYLKEKLRKKQTRVGTRYAYYEMKNVVFDLGISTPPDLKKLDGNAGMVFEGGRCAGR